MSCNFSLSLFMNQFSFLILVYAENKNIYNYTYRYNMLQQEIVSISKINWYCLHLESITTAALLEFHNWAWGSRNWGEWTPWRRVTGAGVRKNGGRGRVSRPGAS